MMSVAMETTKKRNSTKTPELTYYTNRMLGFIPKNSVQIFSVALQLYAICCAVLKKTAMNHFPMLILWLTIIAKCGFSSSMINSLNGQHLRVIWVIKHFNVFP